MSLEFLIVLIEVLVTYITLIPYLLIGNKKLNFYPAIDIRMGNCVRLEKGDLQTEVIFNPNPLEQAQEFERAGCEWIHIVDLDGAISGKQINSEIIKKIRLKTKLKIQLGGGIRSIDVMRFWRDIGIDRVMLGTLAVTSPQIVMSALKELRTGIGLALDSRKDQVATKGWVENSSENVFELAKRYEDSGVEAIIFTDIDKDGLMEGLNLEKTKKLAETVSIPVIASGGLNCLDDLKKAQETIPNLDGVICGKALYQGKIDIEEATRILKNA